MWDGQLDNSVFIMSNAEVDAEPTTHPSFFRYPVVPVTQTGHFTSNKVREGGEKRRKVSGFSKKCEDDAYLARTTCSEWSRSTLDGSITLISPCSLKEGRGCGRKKKGGGKGRREEKKWGETSRKRSAVCGGCCFIRPSDRGNHDAVDKMGLHVHTTTRQHSHPAPRTTGLRKGHDKIARAHAGQDASPMTSLQHQPHPSTAPE